IVGDESDAGEVRARVLIFVHENLLGPTYHVRVGHDALAPDDKPRAAAAPDRFEAPGRVPDRLLAERHDLNHRILRLGAQAQQREGRQQKQTEEMFWHAAKMLTGGKM